MKLIMWWSLLLLLTMSLTSARRGFDGGLNGTKMRLATINSRPSVVASDASIKKRLGLASAFDAVEAREHWLVLRAIKSLLRIPPVTACYLTGACATAICSWALPGLQLQRWLSFDFKLLQRGQVWRLYGPFLNLGSHWLEFVILAQSLAMYMGGVEVYFCRCPAKFLELVFYASTSLSVGALLEGWYRGHFASMDSLPFGLSLFFVYVWSRCNEGAKVNCLDFVEIDAELVPWLVLLQNCLLGQVSAMDLVALAFAYLYVCLAMDSLPIWPFDLVRGKFVEDLYEPFCKELA